VRLVDDHAAEAVLADPVDVPVEDLVVDDHDVGEPVDGVAVAVDHRHGAVRRPELGLAGPVGLDDVGDDGEQRVGAGDLRRQQRLRGLAEARLVGQQEGAVPLGDRREHLGLMGHQLQTRREHRRSRVGQIHARRRTRDGVLERVEHRPDQLPAGQPALGLRLHRAEVGDQERVGQLGGPDGLRDRRPALGTYAAVGRRGRLLLRLGLEAAGLLHLALELPGGLADLGVLLEQPEQRRLPRGEPREVGRDALEPLAQVVALRVGQ
jgi:hypothetical protein